MIRMFDSTQKKVRQQIDFIPGFNNGFPEDETFQAFENSFAVCVDHRIHYDVHLVVQESGQRSMLVV